MRYIPSVSIYPLLGSFRIECLSCGAYATEFTIHQALSSFFSSPSKTCSHGDAHFSLAERSLSLLQETHKISYRQFFKEGEWQQDPKNIPTHLSVPGYQFIHILSSVEGTPHQGQPTYVNYKQEKKQVQLTLTNTKHCLSMEVRWGHLLQALTMSLYLMPKRLRRFSYRHDREVHSIFLSLYFFEVALYLPLLRKSQ